MDVIPDHETDPPKSATEVLEERLADARADAEGVDDALRLERLRGRAEAYDDAIDVISRSLRQ